MNKVKKIFAILVIVLFVASVTAVAVDASSGRGQISHGLGGFGHSMPPMMGYHRGPQVMSSGMSPMSGRWGPEGGNVYGSHPILKWIKTAS